MPWLQFLLQLMQLHLLMQVLQLQKPAALFLSVAAVQRALQFLRHPQYQVRVHVNLVCHSHSAELPDLAQSDCFELQLWLMQLQWLQLQFCDAHLQGHGIPLRRVPVLNLKVKIEFD